MRKHVLNEATLFGSATTTEAHSQLFQFLEHKPPTIYDRIMDAVYRETHMGGGGHRHFDGSHTIGGSWDAIDTATGDVELLKFVKAHGNELVTPEGIPLMTLDKAGYESFSMDVSDHLGGVVTPGQVRSFLRDMNSVNAGEVLVAGLGSLFLVAAIRSGDYRALSRVVGANLCIGLTTGNPLQVAIGLGGLAYGVVNGQIKAWELLKGSAPVVATVIGYHIGKSTLELSGTGSVLVSLAAGVATVALIAHLEERAMRQVSEELGDDGRYVAVMTAPLLGQEIRVLEHRQPVLGLGI